MNKVAIIGGGITGLVAAYLAAENGKQVTVLEGAPQFGGLLGTFPIGNSRVEHYYHHFFTHDAEINWLIQQLGIAEKLFFRKTSMGILREGRLYPFNTPLDLFRFSPLSFAGKIRFALSSLFLGKIAKWQHYEHIPALDWFYRYTGQDATDAIWKPLLQIKFGSHASKIPLAWMVGRMRQRMNSRKGGDERLGYLEGSLDVLLQALLEALAKKGVVLKANAPATGFRMESGRVKAVDTPLGEEEADAVLLTIPQTHIVPLLAPIDEAYAKSLAAVQYFGAVCTILEMDRPLSDIYWLNVADEGFPFGGIIEHTNFVPAAAYAGRHIAYLSRYYTADEPLASMDEAGIKSLMLSGVKRIFPSFSESHLHAVHVFRSRTAAQVCDLGFSEKVPACKTPIQGLFIGNMSHVYPDERSVNNSIRVAAAACEQMGLQHKVPQNASLSGNIGFHQSSN